MKQNKKIFAYMATIILLISILWCCIGYIYFPKYNSKPYANDFLSSKNVAESFASDSNDTADFFENNDKKELYSNQENSSVFGKQNTAINAKENESCPTVTKNDEVYLGGFPLGIDLKLNSMMITEKTSVITKNGAVYPFDKIEISYGDRLISINNIKVKSINDVNNILQHCDNKISVKIQHNGEIKTYEIEAATDLTSGQNRLGLFLQDSVSGIGTMTFIDAKTNKFAALGHAIKDSCGNLIEGGNGILYNAEISGVIKGVKGKAGALNGKFGATAKKIGTINSNNNFGLYGNYQGDLECKKIALASRCEVRVGKAFIYTTIDKNPPKMYEIQIIKANNQETQNDKSMVLRVVDRELLEKAGGIVQGMSGSPIIQNNKLIGAVTHVFINDPTKGYGLYADWMI